MATSPARPSVQEEAKLSAPDTQAGWLQRLALAQLRVHEAEGTLPTNGRFLYYELKPQFPTDRPSPKRLWGQNLSDALMVLRLAGIVPWEWIKDETRALRRWRSAPSVYAYAVEAIEGARIDCWGGEPPPTIITESRSLAGVLGAIAAEYLAPIIGTGGQVGGVLRTDVIPELVAEQRVLYLGDLNEAGENIEANTRTVVEAEVGALQWERLLLRPAQVRQYRLPAKETTDRRFRNGGRTSQSWESEALGQSRIQQMLRDRLDELLPEPLMRVRVREARQRRDVARRLSRNGTGNGASR